MNENRIRGQEEVDLGKAEVVPLAENLFERAQQYSIELTVRFALGREYQDMPANHPAEVALEMEASFIQSQA